ALRPRQRRELELRRWRWSQGRIGSMSLRALTRAAGLIGLAAGRGCDGCSGGGFDAGGPDLATAAGPVSLRSSVIAQTPGQPVSGDQLDLNATVFVQAIREVTGAVESFACRDLQGTSMTPLSPGTYSFSYELHVAGSAIATASGPSGGRDRPRPGRPA